MKGEDFFFFDEWQLGSFRLFRLCHLAVRSGGYGLVVINPKLNILPSGELIVFEILLFQLYLDKPMFLLVYNFSIFCSYPIDD